MTVKQLDSVLLWKLVWLMDSPNDHERQRAADQAAQLCRGVGLRFGDALQQSFGGSGTRREAELERQLDDARRGGDELAGELRRQENLIEMMRLIIAGLVGGVILAAWLYKFPPQEVTHRWSGYGLLLASVPFVFLAVRRAVLRFKRRNRWVTWRDNDVFRFLARWWNRIVRKFLIQV
jgi:hypothetical protein